LEIILFLAGMNTTLKALAQLFYLLAKDMYLQSELQEEVKGMDIEQTTWIFLT
jgi:cytochrome P450